jgi:lactate racemase
MNRRAAESDLIVYVNINLVAMDGGWKSTATGLSGYAALKHHHNVHTMVHSRSFMDQHKSELHKSNWRQGKVLRDAGVKIFQIETTVNNNTFGYDGPMAFLQKREWEWSARDRAQFVSMQTGLKVLSSRAKRKIFQSWEAPYELTSVQAGEVEAVHKITTENVYRQQLVSIGGQSDILTMGLPYICPYNVNSIMNPILVMCLGLGYFFNMYRNKPLVREGGVVIMTHPTPWEFHPVHHPSYIDFFEQVLADTTDPAEIEKKYEQQYAEDEWYIHLYRTSYAYHGVHPFYMWYWGAHALQHLGRVIIVGGDQRAVRRLGFMPASTLQDALEMASDVVGRDATITHLHNPPIVMADVS